MRIWWLAVALGLALAAPLRAAAENVVVFPIAGAAYAVDPSGTMTFEDARTRLHFLPAADFRNPGTASPLHPLVVWLRVPFDPAWDRAPWYVTGTDDVGRATLWYVPLGAASYVPESFGMRVPYEERLVARVPPTLRIPPMRPGSDAYVRLSLDVESRLEPTLRIVDESAIVSEDDAILRLSSTALIFLGVFLSLAVANLFVFAFIREPSYLFYSGWMLANALFAATYLHAQAWKWLWPGASIPEALVQTVASLLLGTFLLWFARLFLESREYVPRADRIVTVACFALLANMLLFSLVLPSVHVGPLIGRDVFLLSILALDTLVFGLGVAVALTGSVAARFFLAANFGMFAPSAAVVVSNLYRHNVRSSGDYIALMAGLALEGWVLFGALAYRLRETVRDYLHKQYALEVERKIASTDALTQIANRRTFDDALPREWDRCARTQQPLSLLVLDIDYFKRYNDTYGHVLGDETLRRVATAIRDCATRPGDLCCRYGGEEFVVILPQTSADGACAMAEEIRAAVHALGIPHSASPHERVTVSIGVATVVPASGQQPFLLQRADEALYRAKQEGRNRYAWAVHPAHERAAQT